MNKEAWENSFSGYHKDAPGYLKKESERKKQIEAIKMSGADKLAGGHRGKESYSDLLKRTKGMGWFEAGQEHMKHMGHKQKDLQTKEQYKKMIDNAKAYD